MFRAIMIIPLLAIITTPVNALEQFETDIIKTSGGDLKITFVGHGSIIFNFDGKNIYIDPYSELADFSKFHKADIIMVTHEHFDHLDLKAIESLKTEKTEILISNSCLDKIKNGVVLKNGDIKTIQGIKVEAIPAYNIKHKRDNGQYFHPKGIGNGYIMTFGDKQIYIAGDTENIPEMKALKKIDIAFLPMNLPYTMTPEMVADAANAFKPEILYPYHFGETDTSKIKELLKNIKTIDVRIRKMK